MTKKNIVIIGASGHASVIIDIIEQNNQYNILGLIDSYKPKNSRLFDYKILGAETDILQLIQTKQIFGGIVAIGDNSTRKLMVEKIKTIAPDFSFINAIHPSAIIGKGVTIGFGNVIVAGTIINSNSNICNHCIINTKASIGHDSTLASFSSVASGATLGGGVKIGESAIICLGSTVLGNLTIGKHALLGAGAVAVKNIPNNAVAIGVPAKVTKQREENTPYL